MKCINCNGPVSHSLGPRPKLYCSVACRVAFHRKKKANDGVKKTKGRPRKALNGMLIVPPLTALSPSIVDEMGKYAVGTDPYSKGPSKAKVVLQLKKQPTPAVQDPVSLDLPALVRENHIKSIEEQIKAIKAEKIPKERDTSNGRKSWTFDQQKRINELQNQLK